MPDTSITIDRRGPAAWLTVTHATLDAAFIRELRDACESIASDDDVRSVVVTGTVGAFAASWDKPMLSDIETLRVSGVLDDPFGCLAQLPKPVICAASHNSLTSGAAPAPTRSRS